MFKTVFFTLSATLSTLAFVSSLFLNSILATFGLVSTSIETLNKLHQSKQIVEQMKTRHTAKKKNFSKKFIQRAGAKISSTATSAIPIVGAVGAVIAVASIEVRYYCEDKQDLHEDENTLYGTQSAFDNEQCLQEAQDDSKQLIITAKESASKTINDTWSSLTQ